MKHEKAPEGATVLTTYAEIERYILAFPSLNLLILLSSPGLQKSRLVHDIYPDGCWIEGHATAFGIYKRLWEYRDEPVIIDDVDSLYSDRGAVRLLKCLCQTERRKAVAWESDAPALQRENIPKRFTTSSRVMIIANTWRTLNANVTALEDRGHLVYFDPSPMEVHNRTAGWFWDQEVFDWIADHLHLVERPSMRAYRKAWELKIAGLDWKADFFGRLFSGPALLAAKLKSDTSFATEEDRAKAFVEQGGGCRATYFNHAKKLRPAMEPPRIKLTAQPPGEDEIEGVIGLLRKRHGEMGNG